MEVLSLRLPEISDEVRMSKVTNKPVFTFEDLRVSLVGDPAEDSATLLVGSNRILDLACDLLQHYCGIGMDILYPVSSTSPRPDLLQAVIMCHGTGDWI